MITTRSDERYGLFSDANGRHRFGGPATHSGIVPPGESVPLQLALSLDLSDPAIPLAGTDGLTRLPLYHPFKYGSGGGALQYAVKSDREIEILYISDEADEAGRQYVEVEELPAANFSLRLMKEIDGAVVDRGQLIAIGGPTGPIVNAGPITCRNSGCSGFGEPAAFRQIASVPPLAIDGEDDFWYEFQGGWMAFYFGLCERCGTIITSNTSL